MFCKKCGNQVDDESKFCARCGTPVSGEEQTQSPDAGSHVMGGKRLHCPECGGTRLNAIVESTTTGAVGINTAMTRRVGVSGYNFDTTHRNYWLCHNCGSKFRNLQNLREENNAVTKKKRIALVLTLVFLLLMLVCIVAMNEAKAVGFLFAPLLVVSLTMTLVMLGLWAKSALQVKKMNQEIAYLEANCFGKLKS